MLAILLIFFNDTYNALSEFKQKITGNAWTKDVIFEEPLKFH